MAERFVWPPVKAAPAPDSVQVQATEHRAKLSHEAPGIARPRSRWRSELLEFERAWLGLSTPPLADRMAEAGWAPDETHRYCGRCGSTVGPHDADDTGCSACRARRMEWERMVRLGAFTGLLREMVLEVKFTRWRRLGHELGGLLGQALLAAAQSEGLTSVVLVPVPMSARRRLVRGIDHAMVIARGASEATGWRIVRGLERLHRPAQARLPASERTSNVAGSIRARERADFKAALVIVLDDVTTTRATMTAACRAVRKALPDNAEGRKPRIWSGVLGVTPVPAPRGGRQVMPNRKKLAKGEGGEP